MDLIRTITNDQLKRDLPPIKSGDTVKVSAKVVEGNRERIQVFEGTVMRLRGGGLNLTMTVRRIASGVGVERTFKVHSPRIDKIEIVRRGVSHRAQLYFLRDRVGKQSSLREKRAEAGEDLNPTIEPPLSADTVTAAAGSVEETPAEAVLAETSAPESVEANPAVESADTTEGSTTVGGDQPEGSEQAPA